MPLLTDKAIPISSYFGESEVAIETADGIPGMSMGLASTTFTKETPANEARTTHTNSAKGLG